MTRRLFATLSLAAALALGGGCSSGDGAPIGGSVGSASGGAAATGGASGGTTGGATGGTATGGQMTGGTVGSGGVPEQSGGHSGAGGGATGGHPSGGMAGSALTGTGGGGAGGLGGGAARGGAGGATATGGAAGGTAAYAPCPTDGSACKILPFGDSITEGALSSDDAGYRSQLFKLIVAAKQKVTFVGSLSNGPTQVSGQAFPRMHEGHSGWTIDPGLSEYSGYSGISTLVPSPALNGKPNIILLHIGANELFPTHDGVGMATRLDALVEKLAEDAPTALIVLAQITPVGSTNKGHTAAQVAAANDAQMVYNSKIPGIVAAHAAKGQHIIGVDMSKMPLSDLSTASVHPNDQGYAYMANIWYAALQNLLPK